MKIVFSFFKRPHSSISKNTKSITLIELIVSILIVSTMVLCIYSLETFSHGQVINSDRRVKVQNDLAYALEHMSKYLQQANGNRPVFQLFPPGNPTGFRVWVDFNNPHTPSDYTDDAQIRYSLSGNTLSASCSGGLCGSFVDEDLSGRIISGFSNTIIPDPLPSPPSSGFYFIIDPDSNGMSNVVEIGLIGLYDPSASTTPSALLTTNPQVMMKTRVICSNCSTN
ncbi:MAG: hypothetical protein PHC29_05070 [Candidatus Omnitrophica bacterium]|nr:hypothetical protein [Candidatus Omnitrophota bacterium]